MLEKIEDCKNNEHINWNNSFRSRNFHILVISCEEKIVKKSPLCWEWIAAREREADDAHERKITSSVSQNPQSILPASHLAPESPHSVIFMHYSCFLDS